MVRTLPFVFALVLTGSAHAAGMPQLDFSNAPSEAKAIAQVLMEAERGEPIESEYVSVALIDLDFDGADEIFAFADASYFCGSAGCVPRIYRAEGDGWREMEIGVDEFINSYPQNWSVAPEPQNGHVVLILAESSFSTAFVWNGEAYVSREALDAAAE